MNLFSVVEHEPTTIANVHSHALLEGGPNIISVSVWGGKFYLQSKLILKKLALVTIPQLGTAMKQPCTDSPLSVAVAP